MSQSLSEKDDTIKTLQKKIIDLSNRPIMLSKENNDTNTPQKISIDMSKDKPKEKIKEKSKFEPEIIFNVSD